MTDSIELSFFILSSKVCVSRVGCSDGVQKTYNRMIKVTKQQAIDQLLANNYRAIELQKTVDMDGENVDIFHTMGYVSKEDKHVPLKIHEKNMDMYDFIYIVEECTKKL
jgi:hypothetical protein